MTFRPASSFTERAGLFISLTGGTNSGKSFSALRLARGIAGPTGKVAVLDTEGGRMLHLKNDFAFDADVMDPPFRPDRFATIAKEAEDAGYACLVIDSFSMEWVGLGGVLDWQAAEIQRMAGDDYKKQERMKMASWIKPKGAHKAMVYSLLQRRIPIIFSIRGEESVKPGEAGEKPAKIFKSVCSQTFPYEVTVSFRLAADRKGYIDLSDPKSWKLEGAHHAIFKDGERISEDHGHALAEWARGGASKVASQVGDWVQWSPGGIDQFNPLKQVESIKDGFAFLVGHTAGVPIAELTVGKVPSASASEPDAAALIEEGNEAADFGMPALEAFWRRISAAEKRAAGGATMLMTWKSIAAARDAEAPAEEVA